MRRLWTRERRRCRGGPWRYQPPGLINGHLGAQCGMPGRGRECEVTVEVKASVSLSGASDIDETLSFTGSRVSSLKETCVHMPAMPGL